MACAKVGTYDLFQNPNSWQFTDLMANYQGGFIRRGLSGTLLPKMNEHGFSVNPGRINQFQAIISIALISIMTLVALPKRPFASGYLLLYSPVFISVFYFLDPQASGRKDSLNLIFLAALLLVYERTRGRTRLRLLGFAFALVLPMMILNHKAIIFFCMAPGLLLLALSWKQEIGEGWRALTRYLGVMCVPSLAVIGAVVTASRPEQSSVIESCTAWTEFVHGLQCNPLPTYFEAIYNDQQFRDIAMSAFTSKPFYLSLLVTIAYMTVAIRGPLLDFCRQSLQGRHEPAPSALPTAPNHAKFVLLGLMIVSFAPSLPLYFLASDFGRWFFMSWTTLTLLLASPSLVQSFQDALSPCLKALN